MDEDEDGQEAYLRYLEGGWNPYGPPEDESLF